MKVNFLVALFFLNISFLNYCNAYDGYLNNPFLSRAENGLQHNSDYQSQSFGGFKESYDRSRNNGFLIIVFLVIQIIAILFSLIHNFIQKKLNKGVPNFIYIYFISYYLFLIPLIPIINSINPNFSVFYLFGISLFSSIIFWVPAYFCLKRNFGAFVIATIVTLNPMIWIISLVYGLIFIKSFRDFREPPPLPPDGLNGPKFILHDGVNQYEPMTRVEIEDKFKKNEFTNTYLYWNEKSQEWRPVTEIFS
jgi:hypothetical protein